MPWRQVVAMTERFQFLRDARQRLVTFTEALVVTRPCRMRAQGPDQLFGLETSDGGGRRPG